MGVTYTLKDAIVQLYDRAEFADLVSVRRPERLPYGRTVVYALTRPGWRYPRWITTTDSSTRPAPACLSPRLRALLDERSRAVLGLIGALEPALRAEMGETRLLVRVQYLAASGNVLGATVTELLSEGNVVDYDFRVDDEAVSTWTVAEGFEGPKAPASLTALLAEFRRGLTEIIPAAGSEL